MTQSDYILQAGELIKVDEGFSGVPYKCPAGYLTIGYGRNLEANPLTPSEAEILMHNDIEKVDSELKKRLPYFAQLTPARKVVLISMAFQLGLNGLLGFRRTLAFVALGDFENASKEMLRSQWSEQTPKRARRLAEMMRVG
jgi:lysozyme